jgi:tRNA A-37 threonylcarbamoyl transferase component Bud32
MNQMPVTHVDRYEIEKTLGRGAMGIVYLARDPLIDRRVALKTLRLDVDAEIADEFRERFLREAQAAGRLNHPGIVTIHDIGEDRSSGVLYIAMEFIDGRDLKQILATGHRFRPSEAARIVADVAVALDYAHQMGVVHRDIKPGNLILTHNGSARIADFGIARMEHSSLTVDGQFIGTPNFMSPEQITGLALDGRSDLFSLGVVLFTLLTGQRPFTAETMHEVTRKILEEPPPIPSTVDENVPAAFNPIVMKLLDKDPDKRFQTGAELAKVLAALARSLVRREPSDDHGTSVHDPDLDTRAGAGLPPIRVPESRAAPGTRLRDAWRHLTDRISLPEPLTWEVMPGWASVIIGVWAVLWLTVAGFLMLQRPAEMSAAPSAGATRNLHRAVNAMWTARKALADDRLEAARDAGRVALDQAPASPAARALVAEIADRMETQRTSAATQQRVSELVAEGRRAYRAGNYTTAASRFREALDLDPQSELAADYLDLVRDRGRQARQRPTASRPSPDASTELQLPAAGVPAIRHPPGNARITVYYNCPINSGSITVAVDGETVSEIPFDHTKKGFLGIKTEGRGTIKRVLLAPSGPRTVAITLIDAKRGVIGSEAFRQTLPNDSEWTLRIDQEKIASAPSFKLIKTSR